MILSLGKAICRDETGFATVPAAAGGPKGDLDDPRGVRGMRAGKPRKTLMITNEPELRALMIDSQNGDAVAHRMLLVRLSCHLRDYYRNKLASIGRSAADVEDLMQDTLMAIRDRRHTYDPRQPFTPWVHAIARYKLVDHLRRTKAGVADVPIDEAVDVKAQDDHAGIEDALDLQRLLGGCLRKCSARSAV